MESKTGMLFLATAPMPLGARETAREFSDISLKDCICGLGTNISDAYISALVQWINNLHKKSLQKNIYFIWLYQFHISANSFIQRKHLHNSQRRNYTQSFLILKRRKGGPFAPLLCFPPFFVCLLLFHRCEWSCFPLSCSHLSRSWHQTRSTQVCSNQSQLVMDTKHPVKEL